MSEEEKRKANQFKFEKDKIVYQTARGTLRLLLSRYQGKNPKEIQFVYSEFGKPLLKVDSSLKFNVSHSADRIAIAVSHSDEVGIDIEKIKHDFNVLELARNFFSKDEIAALDNFSSVEQTRAFYRCWTRKESFIKAWGSGLSFPLDKFTVSINQDDQVDLLKTDWDLSEKRNWSLFSFIPEESYIGAVAIRNKLATIKYLNWHNNQI